MLQILNSLECQGLSGDCFTNDQLEVHRSPPRLTIIINIRACLVQAALEFAQGDFDEAMVFLCSQAENDEDGAEWVAEHCSPDFPMDPDGGDFGESGLSNSEDDDMLDELEAHHEAQHGEPAAVAGGAGHTCRNNHPIELSDSTDGVYALGNW